MPRKPAAEKPAPSAPNFTLAFTPATRRRFKAAGQLDFEAEARYATQLISNNETLLKAANENPESLASALLDAAKMNLSLSPAIGHGYLVPRRVKDVWHVFFVPSYRGLEAMVLRSGLISMIQSDLVFSNDAFRQWTDSTGKHIHHEHARGDRGDFEGAYTIAFFSNGKSHVEFMPAKDVNAAFEQAKKMNFGKTPPSWAYWPDEMRKKCSVRRGWKHWPHDTVIATAMEAIARVEPLDFDNDPEPEPDADVVSTETLNAIADALTEVPASQRGLWIERGAQAMGVLKSTDLPANKAAELKDRLIARMKLVAERKGAAS